MRVPSAIGNPTRISIIDAVAHLAGWVGLYTASVGVMAQQLLTGRGAWPNTRLLATLFAAGVGMYMLDRLKLVPAWREPADAEANPARDRFIHRHAHLVRVLGAMCTALAFGLGWTLSPWIALLVIGGHAGVVLYAMPTGRIGMPRVKDRVWTKNPAVALALLALTMLPLAILGGTPMHRWGLVSAFVFSHVLIDAALCDLDDAGSDRRHGTRTLANSLGPAWTWAVAWALNTAWIPVGILLGGPWLAWSVLLTLGLVPIHWRDRRNLPVRDAVDARLAIVAVVVTLLV